MTRDISDGVRCDTEVSVDVVSVRSWIRSRETYSLRHCPQAGSLFPTFGLQDFV